MTELATALQCWESGRGAARKRFDEVVNELDQLLAQSIRNGLSDPERWASMVDASERRVGEPLRELEDAWMSLERAALAAIEAAGMDTQQRRRLRYQLAEQRRRREQLAVYMAREGRSLLTARRSDAARVLHTHARREWSTPRPCGHCGADIVVGAVVQPTDFICVACGHAAPFGPGPATVRYMESLDGLCDEQTLETWQAYQEARRTFEGYQWPTEADYEVLETAVRTWLAEWSDVHARLLPPGGEPEESARFAKRVAAELRSVDDAASRSLRIRMGAAMKLAAAGDMAGVLQFAKSEPGEVSEFVGQLCTCLHEHGNRGAAWQALALLHHVTGQPAERDAWMQQQLMALDDQLRTR